MLSFHSLLKMSVLSLAMVTSVACSHAKIGDSQVPATPENKALADALEQYRRALEAKDINSLLNMVSAEYFEDGGTSDPSDDYDFSGLKQHLTDDMARIQAQRVTVRLHDINVEGDRAYVDYRFQVRALASLPAGEQWITKTDDNRLSFRKEGGRWRIVAGL